MNVSQWPAPKSTMSDNELRVLFTMIRENDLFRRIETRVISIIMIIIANKPITSITQIGSPIYPELVKNNSEFSFEVEKELVYVEP